MKKVNTLFAVSEGTIGIRAGQYSSPFSPTLPVAPKNDFQKRAHMVSDGQLNIPLIKTNFGSKVGPMINP